jgi:hypothetical protein
MLKYVGNGDLNAVNIRIYGDGYGNEIIIDLTKAPFMLDWGVGSKLNYPKNVDLANIAGTPQPSSVSFGAGQLQIVFDTPPPLADFAQSTDPYPKPAVSFTVNMIYGMQITGKDAHNSDS